MSNRFSSLKYDALSLAAQEEFRKMFLAIEEFAQESLPESREKSLIMTALEEAYMWAGKAIRDVQIARNALPEFAERNE